MSVSVTATPLSSTTHTRPLNILHTSDWHLGRRLYGRMRYDEFVAFLNWLSDAITTQQVDVLIVAGDIFDTMTPSNKAQALYYEFLGKVSKSCCQHIVIVAGNHDSPTFLDAPSQVLKFLNVHVIGTACEDLNDEVLILNDADGIAHCIIAAVPYLRDRDVRSSGAGESMDSKDASVISGICAHYDAVAAIAKAHQQALAATHAHYIPIIATGHLFAAGGSTTTDDGVRDLYVGNLGKISAKMFDASFDYVALGHLHVPQRVGGREHIRYSGSPIAMGFGEARQQKQVLLVQFGAITENIAPVSTPSPSIQLTSETIPTQKLANNRASNNDFIDDLFGFDELDDTRNHDNKETVQVSIAITETESKLLHRNESRHMEVTSLSIPCFQRLAQVSGDLEAIKANIQALTQSRSSSESVWLEVIYTGDSIVSDLREQVAAMVEGLPCEILITKNPRDYNKVLNQEASSETLQDLNEMEVFERCLSVNDVTDEQKLTLRAAYGQILHAIHDKDSRAE
ncbi:exonuclease SbcCD subunit D C-terminal domain-containing protein [Psychrobacter frigidicola]|uniref:exonuclease SbcCD subunit D C-terminal domain-containing protein n=1 Tax=Psychrobacter frigidicola TaxID=45611 RepID=UPI00191B35A1|nr:exonuclease SbcCD subunit D C-terminal domain-containing protein [Psychrobacter frigidicola]